VEQILSGKPREEIVMSIHDYLHDLATKIRSHEIDLTEFIVTKGFIFIYFFAVVVFVVVIIVVVNVVKIYFFYFYYYYFY
jgi:hypothetical protein